MMMMIMFAEHNTMCVCGEIYLKFQDAVETQDPFLYR